MRKVTTGLTLAILLSVMMIGRPSFAEVRDVQTAGYTFVPPVLFAQPGDGIRLTNQLSPGVPHTWTTDVPICLGRQIVPPYSDIAVNCRIELYHGGSNSLDCVKYPDDVGFIRCPFLLSSLPSQTITSEPYRFYCAFHAPVMEGRLYIEALP